MVYPNNDNGLVRNGSLGDLIPEEMLALRGGAEVQARVDLEADSFGGIPRVMPDAVILADGKVVFLNGAQTGSASIRVKA